MNLHFNKNVEIEIYQLVIPVIASPAIGFILSSIIIGAIQHFSPESEFLSPPDEIEQEYLEVIFDNFQLGNSGVVRTQENIFVITNFRFVYLNHQVLLRRFQRPEIMGYTTRRMDIYWTHINTIFSIISGLIMGIILNAYTDGETTYCTNFFKLLWLIPIVTYIFFGILQARRAIRDSNEFEKIYLINRNRIRRNE